MFLKTVNHCYEILRDSCSCCGKISLRHDATLFWWRVDEREFKVANLHGELFENVFRVFKRWLQSSTSIWKARILPLLAILIHLIRLDFMIDLKWPLMALLFVVFWHYITFSRGQIQIHVQLFYLNLLWVWSI